MTIVTKLFAAGLLTWIAALAMLIAVRALRGDIKVSGFLASSEARAGVEVQPERVVAMVAFPLVLLMYTMSALHADMAVVGTKPVMPDVPEYLLTLLTGGNGLYLAGKLVRRP